MIGDLFLIMDTKANLTAVSCFRPHDWGSFFNDVTLKMGVRVESSFRPHDWGSFFNSRFWALVERFKSFRPHDWGSFFNTGKSRVYTGIREFSSP